MNTGTNIKWNHGVDNLLESCGLTESVYEVIVDELIVHNLKESYINGNISASMVVEKVRDAALRSEKVLRVCCLSFVQSYVDSFTQGLLDQSSQKEAAGNIVLKCAKPGEYVDIVNHKGLVCEDKILSNNDGMMRIEGWAMPFSSVNGRLFHRQDSSTPRIICVKSQRD